MINCAGVSEPEGNINVSESRAYSIFHVAVGVSGEPVLACTYRNSSSTFVTVPVVEGVESFQVLYGVYGVTKGSCSAPPTTESDPPPDLYLTAKEIDAGGYCQGNWARVRSIRIGMLLRGPVASAPQRIAQTFNVLGANFSDVSRDSLAQITTPADGRLRQQQVFTVHLRNVQYTPTS